MAPIHGLSDEASLRVSVYNPDYLLRQSRWIRDDLDLQVARDGPDALHSNDILTLDEFLRRLLDSNISLDDIRTSRMHLAIEIICGKSTRWPLKLIDKAELLRNNWEKRHGSLKSLTVPLYESGGRLYGLAKPEDVTNEQLLVHWLKAPGVTVSPQAARKCGDLGFKPGESVSLPQKTLSVANSATAGGSARSLRYKQASSKVPTLAEASHSTRMERTPSC